MRLKIRLACSVLLICSSFVLALPWYWPTTVNKWVDDIQTVYSPHDTWLFDQHRQDNLLAVAISSNGTLCGTPRLPPRDLREQQKWIEIENNVSYAFSAFYDNISDPTVRVVGVKAHDMTRQLKCRLWFSEDDIPVEMLVVEADIWKLEPGNDQYRFGSVVFICRVPVTSIPYGVAMISSGCEYVSEVLPILSNTSESREVTICISPLHSKYDKLSELVESIELNKILGANKFFFYNHSSSSNINLILKWYVDNNLAEVINWPPFTKGGLTYFGQLAALNDCLFRNRYSSRFIVNQDLDEFITPRKTDTWVGLIKDIDPNSSACVYNFRQRRFSVNWNDTDTEFSDKHLAQKYKSKTLLKLTHENYTFNYPDRSKYIIRPLEVELAGIHRIYRTRSGCKNHIVNPDIALLHHYRKFPGNSKTRIADDTMLKYKDRLLKSLADAWSRFEHLPLGTSS